MKWITKDTVIWSDKTIMKFYDNGIAELYPAEKSGWKSSGRPKDKFGNKMCFHTFKHKSKKEAIKVWEEVEQLILNENKNKKNGKGK